MDVVRCVLLGLAAGMNPWLALLIALGLATFSSRVTLGAPLDGLTGLVAVAVLAVVLGADVVLGKLSRVARPLIGADAAAGVVTGATLVLSTVPAASGAPRLPYAAAGAVLALAVGLAKLRALAPMNRHLPRLGHVALGIVADLLAAIAATLAFALASVSS